MLTELRVRNLAVVDEVAFAPGPGLNVISGETGAGKSILVGAIELLLGSRGGPDLIRTGADLARIEGVFQFDDDAFFRKRGLDIPLTDGALLLSREIYRNGRSRLLVNDELTTLARLRTIGEALADLHGQHEHQALLRSETHVDYLDRFGASLPARAATGPTPLEKYRLARTELADLARRHAETVERRARAFEQRETLAKDAAEIEAAALKAGEEEALRAERGLLVHAEKLKDAIQEATDNLSEGDVSVQQLLGRAVKRLGQAAGLDPALEALMAQVEEARLRLEDAGYQLARYGDRLNFEPDRAESIEDRLALIARLRKKYGGDESAILERGAAMKAELLGLDDDEAALRTLAAAVDRARAQAVEAGEALRAWRREAATRLERGVGLELSSLGMPKARLTVRMEPLDGKDGAAGETGVVSALGEKGLDRIEFFLEANPGEEARPLSRVASGGELSRIMLGLKAVLRAADPLPILLFDEVDAGIGGQVASVVGERLREIARGRQVFVITHLATIACQADRHFRVVKTIERGRTVTTVSPVSGREREEELARMLSGDPRPETLKAARALLESARKGTR